MTEAVGDLALVMGGGGARAAYQVGFLSHVARHHPDLAIPILSGVSAGAINTSYLANHTGNFQEKIEGLVDLWSNLTTDQVFQSGATSLLRTALGWGLRLVSGGSRLSPPTRGMVDTTPLRGFLERALGVSDGRLTGIPENLERGRLKAVGITTTDYTTSQSITWVQGVDPPMWRRPHRRSEEAVLTVDHVLASSALPLFFPAVKLGDSWHGDGGIRLTAPLSPALHLGARRVLAISTRYRRSQAEADRPATEGYPPPAQVLGILMNAIFIDMMDYDALNMDRINQLLAELPEQRRMGLRPAELLLLRPSRNLARMAGEYEPKLPQPFRFLTRGLGTRETKSPDSLSMVMFEPEYLRAVIRVGQEDAERRLPEVSAFLAGDELPAMQRTGFWRI